MAVITKIVGIDSPTKGCKEEGEMITTKKKIENLRDQKMQTEYENNLAIWDALIILAQAIDNLFFYKKDE